MSASTASIDKPRELITTSFALSIITISAVGFFILHKIASKIVDTVKYNDPNANLWRLKNTCVSWLHSIICSILTIRRFVYSVLMQNK